MKKYILFFFVCLFASISFAQSGDALMQQGNHLYSKKEYEKAIEVYQKVLAQKQTSAALYYNMGNSYYRLANYPSAILYYEKAQKLAPNDEDITTNLKIANLKIKDKIETVPELFFIRWWKALINLFTIDVWAYIGISFVFLFFFSLIFFSLSRSYTFRKTSFFGMFLSIIIAVVTLGFAYIQYQNNRSNDEAIVFTASVQVKSAPDETGTAKFVIHEGLKVRIEDKLNSWIKIKIPNGDNGWISLNDVKIINEK